MQTNRQSSAKVAEEIGRGVRQERERLALRQDELALVAGVSTRVIHQIENGKATSRLDSLVPVLEALGLELVLETSAHSASDSGK
jgi:HTH-type transcriptional regulator / antitoxin HipB